MPKIHYIGSDGVTTGLHNPSNYQLFLQWLVGIFAAYLLVAILVIVAQPFKAKKRDLFGR